MTNQTAIEQLDAEQPQQTSFFSPHRSIEPWILGVTAVLSSVLTCVC